jgi:CO/xanthine dehydrogenase FAD-binding subunit
MVQPSTLDEALALLASRADGWRPFAGGTDLMVQLEFGVLPLGRYVSLWRIDALRGIAVAPDTISIGALTTYTQIRASEAIEREFPILCRAAEVTGGIAVQNRGTIGGNIANASPAADSPPALLAYDAQIEVVSVRGSRRVPYAGFHVSYRKTDLAPDELIARILLPRRPAGKWTHFYRKVGTRRAQAISKVCFAGVAETSDGTVRDVRIALGSVAPVPMRCNRTESAVRGQIADPATVERARSELLSEIAPIDDFRSTAAYRSRVATNLLALFLRRCART